MFHDIPAPILERMQMLESIDARDREDGTTRLERLRQIPIETGRFIALMASMAPEGPLIEIGTSAGYSALWLALACRDFGRKLTTFEILSEKARMARETFRAAEVEDVIELVEGDALRQLDKWRDIAFCFLDAEKEIYFECYELVLPKLVSGGILVADNAINHASTLQSMIEKALADRRVDSMVVPIGKGVLVCRKR